MKVAIILVNYNNKEDTIECIKSLEKTTYKDKNIIVVDNNSKDNSISEIKEVFKQRVDIISEDNEEILNEEKSITLIPLSDNLGFSGANNIGINLALKNNFDYVMLLNNDTIVETNFLEPLMEKSKKNNSITCPKIYYYDNKDILWSCGGDFLWKKGTTHNRGINEKDLGQFNKMESVSFASGCCILVPSEVFKVVGLLAEEYFLYYEDTDFSLKAREKNIDIIYVPDSVIYHKVSRTMGGDESPLVLYYCNRNRLYFNERYNKYKFNYRIYFYFTRIIKILLLYSKGEKAKAKSIIRGIRDYKKNITGKKQI